MTERGNPGESGEAGTGGSGGQGGAGGDPDGRGGPGGAGGSGGAGLLAGLSEPRITVWDRLAWRGTFWIALVLLGAQLGRGL